MTWLRARAEQVEVRIVKAGLDGKAVKERKLLKKASVQAMVAVKAWRVPITLAAAITATSLSAQQKAQL
jgi:hypothetical protein